MLGGARSVMVRCNFAFAVSYVPWSVLWRSWGWFRRSRQAGWNPALRGGFAPAQRGLPVGFGPARCGELGFGSRIRVPIAAATGGELSFFRRVSRYFAAIEMKRIFAAAVSDRAI